MINLFTTTYVKMLFILSPFFVISVFLSISRNMKEKERKIIILKASGIVLVLAVLSLVFGGHVLMMFGVTIDAFRIGAGVILFLAGLDLVRGKRMLPTEEQNEDISIVPLAIPVIFGPSVTGTLLVFAAESGIIWVRLTVIAAVSTAVLTLAGLLLISSAIERLIGSYILTVLSKISGLMISSLAAEMVTTGIRNAIKIGV
jgi:multiple antibiotic resistance protein